MNPATIRHNNFNLIRFISALLVILGHSPELLDGNRHREILTRLFGTISLGELAVDAFFLLSGYLIMQSWMLQPQAWQFLKKRILRIYPGFIVASILSAAIAGPLGADARQYFSEFDILAFLAGCIRLHAPFVPPVFQGTPYPMVNGAMWTISREFACYMIVMVLGVSGALRRRHLWLLLTIVCFIALAWLKLKKVQLPEMRLAVFFFSGGCFYLYRDTIRMKGWLALVMLLPLAIGMTSFKHADFVLATLGGYALLVAAHTHSRLLNRFNALPDISYGVYLYGWPTQMLLIWTIPAISPWVLFAAASTIAIVLGTFSWYLVEEPMLRFKNAPSKVSEPTPPVTV